MSAPTEWPGYVQRADNQLGGARVVSCRVIPSTDGWWVPRVAVSFTVAGMGPGSTVQYAAAAPPERRASAAGSCLPFTSETQALQATPNRGSAQADGNGVFVATVLLPNSYYHVGTMLVPPSLHVWQASGRRVVLPLPRDLVVPYRALTWGDAWPQMPGGSNLPPSASQSTILYANSYPAWLKAAAVE